MGFYTNTCELCKQKFQTDDYNSKFCCDAHRNKAWRRKNRPSQIGKLKKCLVCGGGFKASNKSSLYCWTSDKSSTCRTMAYLIRKRNKLRKSLKCPLCKKLSLLDYTNKVWCYGCNNYFNKEDYEELVKSVALLSRLEKQTSRYSEVEL